MNNPELIHISESDETRSAHILEVYAESPERKVELANLFAQAVGEYIHNSTNKLGFLTNTEQEKEIDTSGGLVLSKSPEALAKYLEDGYQRDEFIAGLFASSESFANRENTILAFKSILATESQDMSDEEVLDFIKQHSGGLRHETGNDLIGCGGAYGKQMIPRDVSTGDYYRDIQNNSYLGRTLLHLLNYGVITSEGSFDANVKAPPLELHIADQPFDPIVPFEFHSDKFFEALKHLSSTNKTGLVGDLEIETVKEDAQHEIIHLHGELAGHSAVSIARMHMLAEKGILYPVVIHAHEQAVVRNAEGELEQNTQESLTKIAIEAVKLGVPIIIENNRYTQDNAPVYHTGAEFGLILSNVVYNTFDKLSVDSEFSGDEQALKARISKYVGITLDFAHFNCAPPHLGQRFEDSGMLTPSKKAQLTIESVEDVLGALDDLADAGFPLERLNLHIGENSDKGKDIHLAKLAGFGNVPNKECYSLVKEWLNDVSQERTIKVSAILEQTGEVVPQEIEALLKGEKTKLEKAAEICPINILAVTPEIAEGEIALLKRSALLSIDIPRWTEINAGGPETASLIHDLTIRYRKELAGMIEGGTYGETFLIAAAGDETSIAIDLSKNTQQDQERAFLLAIDSQLIFWELLEDQRYTKLRERFYTEPPLLHVGIAKDKNLYAQMLQVGGSMLFCPSGGAFAAKVLAKEQGLEHLLGQANLSQDRQQLMLKFFSEAPIEEQVDTINSKSSANIEAKRNTLLEWRQALQESVAAPAVRSREISNITQNERFNLLVPALADTYEELTYVPEDLIQNGQVFFGKVVGFEGALETALKATQEIDPNLSDVFESIISTHIGGRVLQKMSGSGWMPREIEYDKDVRGNGNVNILATSGIFNPGALEKLPTSQSLTEGLADLKSSTGWQEVKEVISKSLLAYVMRNNIPISSDQLAEIIDKVDIEKINICGALVQLDGVFTYAYAESSLDREGAYSGTLHLSGTAMPLAARFAMRAYANNSDKTVIVSNVPQVLEGSAEEEVFSNLKGFGDVKAHVMRT